MNAFFLDRALFDAPSRPAGVQDIEIQQYKSGRVLALQGDRLETVDLVVGGQLRLSRVSASGREYAIAILLAGDVLTTSLSCPYQVLVTRSTLLARIPRNVFEALRARNGDFSARIDATLQRRAALVEQRLEFADSPPIARVANALLELSEYFRGSPELPRTRQNVIGSFAALTRETVCNVMSKLERARAVSVTRRVMYLDLDRLKSLAKS